LLNLFNVSNVFYDSLLANIKAKNMSKGCKQLKYYRETYLKRIKNFKIWFKRLNSYIFKVERLN